MSASSPRTLHEELRSQVLGELPCPTVAAKSVPQVQRVAAAQGDTQPARPPLYEAPGAELLELVELLRARPLVLLRLPRSGLRVSAEAFTRFRHSTVNQGSRITDQGKGSRIKD